MKDDPCLRCQLPDCDIASPRCVLRRLNNSYWSKVNRDLHDQVTREERDAQNAIFQEWHRERIALASEGVKPYRRIGSPWKPGEPSPSGDRA